MTKYYVDTCIWRDYWENRSDNLRPLGEFAVKFFNKIVENEDIIIISDLIIKEMRIAYNDEVIYKIFSIIPEDLLDMIIFTKEQLLRAKQLLLVSGIPLNDALHIIMSKDNQSILISRDNHMIDFGDAIKPEEL